MGKLQVFICIQLYTGSEQICTFLFACGVRVWRHAYQANTDPKKRIMRFKTVDIHFFFAGKIFGFSSVLQWQVASIKHILSLERIDRTVHAETLTVVVSRQVQNTPFHWKAFTERFTLKRFSFPRKHKIQPIFDDHNITFTRQFRQFNCKRREKIVKRNIKRVNDIFLLLSFASTIFVAEVTQAIDALCV